MQPCTPETQTKAAVLKWCHVCPCNRDSMGPGGHGPVCIARDVPMQTWLSMCPVWLGLNR